MKKLKLNFSVDTIELLEFDSSRFSLMKLHCFASGENAHNIGLSDDVLKKAENTIFNVPIVWYYDEVFDDAEGHNDLEVPCGFIPPNSPISYERLEDGRLMMIVEEAVVWKKYSGRLVEIFQRDKEKSVSVEISIEDWKESEDKSVDYEILDFQYEAVTVLGDSYSPAIEGAKAEIIRFARKERKEFAQDYRMEFAFSSSKYSNIDFTIPTEIKEFIQSGMESANSLEITQVVIGYSNLLLGESEISPKKVGYIIKHLEKRMNSDDEIEQAEFMMLGGKQCYDWLSSLSEEMEEADRKVDKYFNLFDSVKSSNIFKKKERLGMDKTNLEDTAQQEEEFENKDEIVEETAEEVISEEVTEVVDEEEFQEEEDKKEDEDEEEDEGDGEDKEEDMSEPQEEPIEEEPLNQEEPVGEEFEESSQAESIEEEFSLNSSQKMYLFNRALSEFTIKDGEYEWQRYYAESYDEDYVYMYDYTDYLVYRCKYSLSDNSVAVDMESKEEVIRGNYIAIGEKEEEFSIEDILGEEGLKQFEIESKDVVFSTSHKEIIEKMFEVAKTLFETNKELVTFKDAVEKTEFDARVEQTLVEIQDYMESDEIDDAREKAQEFTLETLEEWSNALKAEAFSKTKKVEKKVPFQRIRLPFEEEKDNGKSKKIWK